MTTSAPPRKPNSGGNAKYAIVGALLLLGASVAIYFGTRGPAPAPQPLAHAAPPEDAGALGPITPTVGMQIQLPTEEPDAGVQEADAGRHIRYVYRTIAACPGSVDGPRVAGVVRQNYGGLRECYNRQLRSNPTLRGNVTAEWVINPNGTVGQVTTSGGVAHDHTFRSCFETSLSHMRFPQPHGGCALFQQSFNFTPDGS